MIWILIGLAGAAAFVWMLCRTSAKEAPKPWDEEVWWV